MKIIVTGSRDWALQEHVRDALKLYWRTSCLRLEHMVLVHGDCPTGADHFADMWGADYLDEEPRRYPADWKTQGRAAGPIRNQQMVDENLDADYVLGFPLGESRGTRGCMTYAESKGLKVINLGER